MSEPRSLPPARVTTIYRVLPSLMSAERKALQFFNAREPTALVLFQGGNDGYEVQGFCASRRSGGRHVERGDGAICSPGARIFKSGGAATGEMNGAANGAAEAGPVGAIVGGAIGTATGALAGTANALAGAPPACAWGYTYYNGACYPAR